MAGGFCRCGSFCHQACKARLQNKRSVSKQNSVKLGKKFQELAIFWLISKWSDQLAHLLLIFTLQCSMKWRARLWCAVDDKVIFMNLSELVSIFTYLLFSGAMVI
jgi:hypothetical protein